MSMMISILVLHHFLNCNLKSFPLMDFEVDYCPTDDSVTALLDHWKKGQIQLEPVESDYLTSLHERAPYHGVLKAKFTPILEWDK